MLYVVLFEDDPERLEVRERHMPAHLEFLARHADRILAAGSLRQHPDGQPEGGLWIVEAGSREEVEAIYAEDPFWTGGLRRSVQVRHWSKAFGGKRPI